MDENVIENKEMSTLITADEPSTRPKDPRPTYEHFDRIVGIAANRCHGDNYERRDLFLKNLQTLLRPFDWNLIIGTVSNREGEYRAGSIPGSIKGCLQSLVTNENHCYHALVIFND